MREGGGVFGRIPSAFLEKRSLSEGMVPKRGGGGGWEAAAKSGWDLTGVCVERGNGQGWLMACGGFGGGDRFLKEGGG